MWGAARAVEVGFEVHTRKSRDCREGNASRNMIVKGHSGEISERKD